MSLINSPQVGGLAGLQNMFQQGGLGNIISSSIGTGQKLPVSASQLQSMAHGEGRSNRQHSRRVWIPLS
jgi:uncharacterized protein YidB (DUF937 family)